ncbi:MAG: WG repeat-containing protein [Bacteroidetes bacterium]|nr:WG repeat-containing protein [Bacteroidota bacterium]
MKRIFLLIFSAVVSFQLSANRLHTHFFIPYYEFGKWGYMDTDGQIVIPPFTAFKPGFFDQNHYAEIYNASKLKGLIDDSGRQVLPVKYVSIKSVQRNVFIVKQSNSTYKLLGRNGIPLIQSAFKTMEVSDDIRKEIPEKKLSNGKIKEAEVTYIKIVVAVNSSGLFMYQLSENGNVKFVKSFPGVFKYTLVEDVYSFSDFILYFKDPKTKTDRYLDCAGKDIEPGYEEAMMMDDISAIDYSDLNSWEKKLDTLPYNFKSDFGETRFNQNYNAVRYKGKWGVVTYNYRIVVPFEYDTILMMNWQTVYLKKNRVYDWYDKKNHQLITLKADTIYTPVNSGVLARVNGRISLYNEKAIDMTPYLAIDTLCFYEWMYGVSGMLLYSKSKDGYALFTSNGPRTEHKYSSFKRLDRDFVTLKAGDSTTVFLTYKQNVKLLGPYKGEVKLEKASHLNIFLFQIQLSNGVWVYIDASGRKYYRE